MPDHYAYGPKTATYLEVRGLMVTVANRTLRGKSLDRDDADSALNLAFTVAYNTYDPTIAEFTTHVGYKVEKALLTAWRRQCARRRRETTVDEFPDVPDRNHAVFDRGEFLRGLSRDARRVVKLVLYPPEAVTETVEELDQGDTAANVRYAVREFLRDLGWSARRIKDAFLEVKGRL